MTDPRVIDPEAPQYNATLVRREDMNESLSTFWVRFDGDPTPFEAGQYMTIGVMVDGRIVQRPYSVASPPALAGSEGYEFYVRLVNGGTFTPLPVADADRPGDADDRPEGQVHAAPRRRPDAHLHLVRDGQRAVRGDDAAAPSSTAQPRRVVFLNGVSYAEELGYRGVLEEWERSGDLPGHLRPDRVASQRPA